MISPAAAELIRRAKEQVRTGIQCALSGELALAEVWFRAATASLEALHALLPRGDAARRGGGASALDEQEAWGGSRWRSVNRSASAASNRGRPI
jgi:hypothetical protein